MNSPVVAFSIPVSAQTALGSKREMSSQGVKKSQFRVGREVGARVGEVGRREEGDCDVVGKRVGGEVGAEVVAVTALASMISAPIWATSS